MNSQDRQATTEQRPLTVAEYLCRLTDSGLLKPEEITENSSGWLPDRAQEDALPLAQLLANKGCLSHFQAGWLYQRQGPPILNNYVLVDHLGSGGMGHVFKAVHRRMERTVALKLLRQDTMQSEDDQLRFYREIKMAAQLQHPNIVVAHDADECEEGHYLVMEYVDGCDCGSLIKNIGQLSIGQALHCVVQAAEGLHYAHDRGIMHRDVKPANLMIDTEGVVKVLDMGLAKTGDSAMLLTRTGQSMGTPGYMSPEQTQNMRNVDHRCDIYSLGCTLYELLSGREMFGDRQTVDRILAHCHEPAPSVCQFLPDDQGELELVYQKMVAKEPSDRFQTMREVLSAFENCQSKYGIAKVVAPQGIRMTDVTDLLDGSHIFRQGSTPTKGYTKRTLKN